MTNFWLKYKIFNLFFQGAMVGMCFEYYFRYKPIIWALLYGFCSIGLSIMYAVDIYKHKLLDR